MNWELFQDLFDTPERLELATVMKLKKSYYRRQGRKAERERIIALLKNSYHRRLCLDPDDVSTDGARDCAIHWEGYACGCDELLALIKGDGK